MVLITTVYPHHMGALSKHKMKRDVSIAQWDLVIKPKTRPFALNLNEVWHYRDLMWLFVRRDFVAQYKQTILGPIWHIIQPLLTSLMFLLVFSKIAKIPTDGLDGIVFYMAGNIIWTYFSTCLTGTSSIFVSNAAIFGKVYFPRLIIPLSVVISNLVKFGITFILLLLTMIYSHFVNGFNYHISFTWLCLPFLLMLLAGIALGSGIIISALTTKYRDFTVLIGFAIQLMMYATPVVYPLSYLKGKSYRWLIDINPLTSIVETFKYSLLGKGTVEPSALLYSIAFMFVVLFFGAVIFNKVEKTFMDTV